MDASSKQILLVGLLGRASHVRVSQVVIPDTTNSSTEFDKVWQQKMSLLLKSSQLASQERDSKVTCCQRFGFVVSCCGRGSSYHEERKNYESSLFVKAFPNVSLTGFFANGEIGSDYLSASLLPTDSDQQENSDAVNNSLFLKLDTFSFSSVYTLVSIKN